MSTDPRFEGTSSGEVAIVDTAVANIASMRAAWRRLGFGSQLVADAEQVASVERLILPGVGAFAAGMDRLENLKLVSALRERIELNRPTLVVCLGFQLLCEYSEECPGCSGIGVLPVTARRFPADLPVPQLGWNQVEPRSPLRSQSPAEPAYFSGGQAYFANSFCIEQLPAEWATAQTLYGQHFVSAAWRGRVLACQFHPELSGPWGMQLLKNWATDTRAES